MAGGALRSAIHRETVSLATGISARVFLTISLRLSAMAKIGCDGGKVSLSGANLSPYYVRRNASIALLVVASFMEKRKRLLVKLCDFDKQFSAGRCCPENREIKARFYAD